MKIIKGNKLSRLSSVLLNMGAAVTLATASAQALAVFIEPYYTVVRAQIDLEIDSTNVQVIETQTNSTFAEVGTAPDSYAKARASFGENGGYAIASDQPANLGAYAESIWVDEFVIGGGTGTGVLTISVLVNGTMDGAGQPGGPGSNSYYQLYVSATPIYCNFDEVVCTGALVIPLTEGISGTSLFTAHVPFTYGQEFYLASYLGAEVLGDGFSDFFSSAHFGATAPDGSAIVGGSGVTYALASAVPEPHVLALLLFGLPILSLALRRGRRV